MSNLPGLPWDAVSEHGRKITTTSLIVAAVFGKKHLHVLRDIQVISRSRFGSPEADHLSKSGLMIDPLAEFFRLNFEPRDYIDERGKTQPMVEITKDGCEEGDEIISTERLQ